MGAAVARSLRRSRVVAAGGALGAGCVTSLLIGPLRKGERIAKALVHVFDAVPSSTTVVSFQLQVVAHYAQESGVGTGTGRALLRGPVAGADNLNGMKFGGLVNVTAEVPINFESDGVERFLTFRITELLTNASTVSVICAIEEPE